MKKLLAVMIVFVVLGCIICDSEVFGSYHGDVEGFAVRTYEVIFNKAFDKDSEWLADVIGGEVDGAAIVTRLIHSSEFEGLNINEQDYINVLYEMSFERSPQPEERQNWVNNLRMGYSRDFVLQKFVNIEEFTEICDMYGIERGALLENGEAVHIDVVRFINRLYSTILDRRYDTWGYCTWAVIIANKEYTLEELVRGFTDTEKYISRNRTDAEYVQDLYMVFFNRVATKEEEEYWVNDLRNGGTRLNVLLCFSRSEEFKMFLELVGLPEYVEH